MILFMPNASSSPNWLADNGTPYAAYYPKGAASYAASIVDVSGNGRNVAGGNLPDGTGYSLGTGWTFNGSTYYLTCPFGIGENYTVACKFSNHAGAAGKYLYSGSNNGAAPFHQYQPFAGGGFGVRTYHYGTNTSNGGAGIFSGVVTTAGRNLYTNGVFNVQASATWAGSTESIFVIGARKATVITGHIQATVEAIAVFSRVLDATEVATLYNGMAIL